MWRVAEIVFWLVFAVLLMASAPLAISGVLTAVFGSPERAPQEILSNLVLVSPAFPLVLGLVAVVRLKFAGEHIGKMLGLTRAQVPRDFLIGLVAGVASVGIAVTSLRVLNSYVDVPPLPSMPLTTLVYFATFGAIVPGFCEELYYRGMLFKIAGTTPTWLVALLTSAGFALWHLATPLYLVHTFILGLLFAALTLVFRRLAPAIFAHTFANVLFGVLLASGLIDLGA
jgi:membrane protease YdiL (CAAX protease family)